MGGSRGCDEAASTCRSLFRGANGYHSSAGFNRGPVIRAKFPASLIFSVPLARSYRRCHPLRMDLDAYFSRIGYEGSPRSDEQTLAEIHSAHLASIPYENLDIQLDEPKILDEARFEKRIVGQDRGGWCYEMNGLLSVALRQIGFRVDRVGGAVARQILGDDAIGNHMVLIVHLDDRKLVADVGLGDGPLYPFPLEERRWEEEGFEFGLERIEGGWWRFDNHPNGLAPNFDFDETPRELDWYGPQSSALQTGEAALFVALSMTFRRDRDRIRALRELSYIEIDRHNRVERTISSFEDYKATLEPLIDFELGEGVHRLWERVSMRVASREALAKRATESG